MRGDGYIEVDAYPGGISVHAYDGSNREGITMRLEADFTSGWEGVIDNTLRQADNIAQILGTHVSYNQLWCELRAKKIGAWHHRVIDTTEEDAERAHRLAIHGPMGAGKTCDIVGCDRPYHATHSLTLLDLCRDHYDQISLNA